MNKIYGYTQGVHVKAHPRDKDLSRQASAIRRYAKILAGLYPYLTIEEIYSDVGQKRSNRGIRTLPAGRQLLLKIGRGDHLIIGNYARVFHTSRDFLRNMRIWKRQGIAVHLAQKGLKISMNAPAGMLLLRFLQDIDDEAVVVEEQRKIARRWRQCRGLGKRLTG